MRRKPLFLRDVWFLFFLGADHFRSLYHQSRSLLYLFPAKGAKKRIPLPSGLGEKIYFSRDLEENVPFKRDFSQSKRNNLI
jgi:hypothetical protein